MCEKSLHVLYSKLFIASTFWQAWQADMDGSNMILAFSMSARANAFNVLWLGDCLEIFPCPAWCLTGIFDDLKVPIKKKSIHIITYAILCLYIYIYGCKSKCTGRSVPWTHRPIHTPDPYQNEGDPDRSILPDHRGPIHTRILTEPHI